MAHCGTRGRCSMPVTWPLEEHQAMALNGRLHRASRSTQWLNDNWSTKIYHISNFYEFNPTKLKILWGLKCILKKITTDEATTECLLLTYVSNSNTNYIFITLQPIRQKLQMKIVYSHSNLRSRVSYVYDRIVMDDNNITAAPTMVPSVVPEIHI